MAIRFAHDPTLDRLAALEVRVGELERLLRDLLQRNAVTPVTRNGVTRNASNAERQRRYRERRAALKKSAAP